MSSESTRRGNLIVLSAPSGTGKSSLVRRLIGEEAGIEFSISATTRAPREGEVDGRDYHFVDHARFEALIAEGGLLEHAEVHGHHYGTPRDAIESRLEAGNDVLLEIDVQGAAQVRAARHAHLIFVLPPSRDELEARLRKRGLDADEVIETRLANAAHEIRHAGFFDFVLVNDDFETAFGQLLGVIRAIRQSRDAMRPVFERVAETFDVNVTPGES